MSELTPYYQDEFATIYLGDCREILPRLALVDLILTDPPYGISITKKGNNYGTSTHKSRRATGEVWDDIPPDAEAIRLIMERSKNQIVFGANYFWECFRSSPCYIVWDKRGQLPAVPFADTEFAWTSFERMSKKYTVVNHGFIKDAQERREHPTQKPVMLFRSILSDFTKAGDVVLDPYMGSGTTLRAAKDLGLRSIGIEIEPKYCEMAARRLRAGNSLFTEIGAAAARQPSLLDVCEGAPV